MYGQSETIINQPIFRGKKLNRGPVAQNLAWAPKHVQTVVQLMSTEFLNISCAKSFAGPQEFWLGY
jgi:hypothetical protein